MAKIFDWLKPTGNPSVNGYDLSQRRTFSMPCGYLNVCYSRMFIPRTKVQMSLRSVINTLPMVNQGFTRGQFLVDVYQVPYTQLYRNFNEFYAQANELFSSQDYDSQLQEYNLPSDIAHANLFGLLWYLLHDMIAIYRDAYFGSTSTEHPTWEAFENSAARYRKFYDWSTNNLLLGFDVHGIPVVLGALRILNMTGYGNWYLVFKDFFLNDVTRVEIASHTDRIVRRFFVQQWVRSFYPFNGESKTEGDLEEQLTAALDYQHGTLEQDWLTFDSHYAFYSSSWSNFITELVGIMNNEEITTAYAPETAATVEKIMNHQYYVSFFPVLAYQKIFADIYRNTFYDSVPAYAFNIDDLFANGSRKYLFEDVSLEPRYEQMLQARYRQFKNDMFTCLLPSSQLGDVSMVQAGDSIYNIKLFDPFDIHAEGDNVQLGHDLNLASDSNVDTWKLSPTPAFSVLVQRRAEALQKYKERYLRAGNRLKDQFISTFGKVPYYLDDKYCRFIGSMHSDLNLQAVPATNDTGNYDVGERASYGYSGTVDKVSFNIDDFSIVMALCYYMPEADYESFQLDEEHTYSEPFDFPVPEFENIGLHSLTRFSLSVLGTPYTSSSAGTLDTYEGFFDGNTVNGYGPAWLGMKTDVDRLYGEFGSTLNLRGDFHTWVTSRGNVSMRSLGDYYICPDYLNSVMVRQQNSNIPSQDQLLCCFDWNIKVVQPLTVVGLPVWD